MYESDNEKIKRLEDRISQLEKQNSFGRGAMGYEYKSTRMIFGMPFVHIANGINPETGRPYVAKGFIAVGNVAIGVFALGGVAIGAFAFGGVAIGLFVFGGLALGLLIGLGGFATGVIALGGMAAGYYALGGGAIGAHVLSGSYQDPALLELFRSFGILKH